LQTNSQKQEIYRKRNQLAIRRLEQIAGITLKEIHRQIVQEEKIMKGTIDNENEISNES